MKRKITSSILLTILLLFGFTFNVDALETDKVTLHYQHDEDLIDQVNVSVYKIADFDKNGVYHYSGNFIDRTESLSSLTAAESKKLAKKFADLIKEKNFPADYTLITDENGDVEFPSKDGAYLVLTDETKLEDNSYYQVVPFFVSVPQSDEDGSYSVYNIPVDVKVELVVPEPTPTPTPTPTGDNNTVPSPSTYDAIVLYVIVFAVCVLGIVIVIVYYINKKKGSHENEKESQKNEDKS